MKRLLYFAYYLRNTEGKKFRQWVNHVHEFHGISRIFLYWDAFASSFLYKISFLEYFQFRFFESDKSQRSSWAGTGTMYEYQRLMNPGKSRPILDDKRLFYLNYDSFIKHKQVDMERLAANPDLIHEVTNSSGKIVLKAARGKCGEQVRIQESDARVDSDSYDLVEEFIQQHPDFNELSPSGVNTIRIVTQLTADNQVEILGCRLRISVDSQVDNLAAGNLAAPIDETTGTVNGPAVYSDIRKKETVIHPVTGVSILGFRIPYWKETLQMARKAAFEHPENRSVGWDIAMTSKGPDMIEGNHDWCKLLWQLPVKRGLKPLLEKHRLEYIQNRSN